MSRRNWYLLTNAVVLAWLVGAVIAVTIHRFVGQPLWLMVHVPLLGAATAAILIWSQHFADTLLRRAAPGGRPGLAIRLALQSGGSVLVIAGMLLPAPLLLIVGAVCVAAAAFAHGVLLALQMRGALPARFALLVRYYIAAALVFLAGIGAGAFLAFVPELADRLVTAHIVLNAFGWIGLTALGTLVLLWPTVLHARVAENPAGNQALPVLIAGIMLAAAGPVADLPLLVTAGMAIWLVGAGMIARDGWRQARAMPPGTFAGWSLAAAFCWVVAAGAALGIQAAFAPDWAWLRAEYLLVLGPLVAGFAVQLLMGALSYLFPVVAIGSPLGARTAAEVLDRGGAFRVVALNGAIALYLLPMPSITRVLLSLLAAGVVVAFLVLVIRALVAGRRARRAEGEEPDRSGIVRLGAPALEAPARPRRALAVAAGFAALALCVAGGVAADPAASGISVPSPPGDVVESGQTTEVTVRVTGMRFDPAIIEVPYGDRLVVTFENTGTDVHDLTFANGVRSARLAPGGSEVLDVGIIGADLAGWCSIAGHRQMGMELVVRVIGAPPSGEGHEGHEHPGTGPAPAVDLERPPAADFEAWPAALDPASEGGLHRITLRATEQKQEVAPGVWQERWTFGGSAPGPVIRGKIGDRFEITLINDGTIGHSIDFHAGALAPDEPMRTILPGETLVYAFTATRAGIWMYHCSSMPMSMHIANGMYGAVIIDPPDLAPADREYVLVQGELYLGGQGGSADAAKIAAGTHDLVAFNGYAMQYRHRPLTAGVGERVRIWVLDAGPNAPSSFHVVGGQFDTVYLEGEYRLRPGAAGGSQALALLPAQGGFVELVFREAGNYPFVTHIMSDAEKGASGFFHVE